ncbi:MAG: hypothetical protein LAO24_12660 [Acidobacteriia bacterium]|nr:hypothetical protein [Terriglobia bacterium]
MTETLQLEETAQLRATQLHEVPKLLVEWSSPWEEFVTSIRPALSRSMARLAGEAPYGLRPYRGMLATWLTEAFLLFVVIVLPIKIRQLRPYVAPKLSSHDVIYYSGDELPRTEDLGGAQAGIAGSAGGNEAHHRTQTIRIARGGSLVEKVVDAPNLKIPASRDAVANLLAIKANPGPPPLEGVRSARPSLTLPADVIAPAPNLTRDYTRGSLPTPSVIPPAPSISRDNPLSAPSLSAAVIAPAPSVSREHTLVAPKLDSSVVAPAPNIAREHARSAPALSGTIIPPAPSAASPEISRSPVQMTDVAVVPPPVSAPERETSRTAKLTMPAPSVIAPPPSADMSRDLHRLASGSLGDPSKAVVPPPPTPSGSGGLMSSLIGKLFGTTDVVPPPPSISGNGASGNPRGTPGGTGTAIGTSVVPPPPSVSGTGGTGRSAGGSPTGSVTANVVPPPPSVTGSGRGAGTATAGGPGGTLLARNVVPPPPSIGGGTSVSGSGRSARGTGLGGPLDTGSVLAPPSGGGNGGGSGVVISNQPGSKVGMPGNAGTGSLAMSPTGGDKPGLGGSGGGSSIGRGSGPGSGMTGGGTGAGKTGTGRGSDPNARGGISPTPGPGGAGSGTSGTPAVPGVSISGGSTAIINLPSFGSDGGSSPTVPQRSSVKQQPGPAITIVATARSGGAFNRYGELPGDNYTVYFDTPFGPASMQFADPNSAGHAYSGDLVGPEPLRADLPPGLQRTQITVRCVLDTSGNLKILSLLESGAPDVTVKVLAAISKWKFRPAMHGDQPVQVNAILGFNTNTDDKF